MSLYSTFKGLKKKKKQINLVLPLGFDVLLPKDFTYIIKQAESIKPHILLIFQIVQTNILIARKNRLGILYSFTKSNPKKLCLLCPTVGAFIQ